MLDLGQPMPNRMSLLAVIGGAIAFVGFLLIAIVDFSTAANFSLSRELAYSLRGAGNLAVGIGLLLAFVGLAIRRQPKD